MLDFSDLPVVDAHCHPYTRADKLSPEQWVDALAFGGGSPAYLQEGGIKVDAAAQTMLGRLKRDTLYFRFMLRRLAEYFGVEATLEAVVAARNRAIARDGYATYAGGLHGAGNIDALIVDDGYPLPQIDLDKFRAEVGVEVLPVFRIEVLIQDLLDDDCGWSEFGRRYDESIAEALGDGGYRGLKSIIAYRTGLDIDPGSRSLDQGRVALEKLRRARGRGGDPVKRLRDHLFCRAIERCIDFDVPFQVHTGMGDWEVHLAACRPALLLELLRYPAYRACKFLLVHSGYPYHAEAGYLANVLPNIWCDISEGLPFAGNAGKRIIAEVLEMAPISRVCYGSDVYGSPEPFYTSALLGKQALGQALGELIEDGFLSVAEAHEAAGMILADNARELYGI
ncbi:MAG: amidohydrolase family protein [Chloroflexota bacterium]|nr:amidohydrolase family protein [Chloroflexota bacterium]